VATFRENPLFCVRASRPDGRGIRECDAAPDGVHGAQDVGIRLVEDTSRAMNTLAIDR
jgi:hypothetical protein